jgi:anti-sigma regulatory factor (Ser/Thr protein kinase)
MKSEEKPTAEEDTWRTLLEQEIASEPGNERLSVERVREAARILNLPAERLASLETAVAEAVMNAMEHGNHYLPDKPVTLRVRVSETAISVIIGDEGTRPFSLGSLISSQEEPDLEAKLAGLQSPRGWGLFLIKNLVDDMHVVQDQDHHSIELVMHRIEPRTGDTGES